MISSRIAFSVLRAAREGCTLDSYGCLEHRFAPKFNWFGTIKNEAFIRVRMRKEGDIMLFTQATLPICALLPGLHPQN